LLEGVSLFGGVAHQKNPDSGIISFSDKTVSIVVRANEGNKEAAGCLVYPPGIGMNFGNQAVNGSA
jgi:hypothetical protein